MSMWQAPAVVLLLLTWFSSPATSLADVARREAIKRQLAPAAPARVYTNDDLPVFADAPQAVSAAPAAQAQSADKPQAAKPQDAQPPAADTDAKHDEAWWRKRVTSARETLASHQLLAEALQSRINGLTADWVNRDDPAQKAKLFEQRQSAIAELDRMKKTIEGDQKAIDGIVDEAKKADVPSGWIR